MKRYYPSIIGGLFNNKEIQSGSAPTSGVPAQQLADIAVNLQLTNVLPGPWRAPQGAVVLVTSARPGEGKTAVATGLAAGVARGGRSVLVIDANLRNPGTHLALGMRPGTFGLSGLLKANGAENIDAAIQRSTLPGVWLMPAGAATDGGALLIEQKLPGILAQLRNKTDLIIIDGPALLISAEASTIASSVDGVKNQDRPTKETFDYFLDFIVRIWYVLWGVKTDEETEKRRNCMLGLVVFGLIIGAAFGDITSSSFFLPPRQLNQFVETPQVVVTWMLVGFVLYKDALWRLARKRAAFGKTKDSGFVILTQSND